MTEQRPRDAWDEIIDEMPDTHGALDFFETTRDAVRWAMAQALRREGISPCEFCGAPSRGTSILAEPPYDVRISCGGPKCGTSFVEELRG